MILSLYNRLRGYVIIEVTGFSVERFVNLAVHKGIYLWDVMYTENGVTMKVSIKGFKLLKSCLKKTKCRMKIIHKQGCPFILHKYRKRKILAGGILFFIALLYALSSFVWLIEVQGNDRIPTDTLVAFCKENGLHVGSFKYGVGLKDLENSIINHYTDISWLNIEIKGTKATIFLTEIIEKQPMIDNSIPCDIIAKKNGVIMSVATSAGRPVVKQKDVVQEGDLLVSSQVVVLENEAPILTAYVHADALVRAKFYYDIHIKVPYDYEEKVYTSESKKRYDLSFMDKKINFLKPHISYENYDKITSRKQIKFGEDYPLPIIFFTETYQEFTLVKKSRTIEQAKELAGRMVTGRIIREFDIEADIIDKSFSYIQESDGLVVKATVTTIEDIGEKVPINALPEQEALPGTEPISDAFSEQNMTP